jgi:hypothetical protein
LIERKGVNGDSTSENTAYLICQRSLLPPIPTAILLHGWRLKKGEKGFGSVKVSRGGNLQGVSLFPNLSMSGCERALHDDKERVSKRSQYASPGSQRAVKSNNILNDCPE